MSRKGVFALAACVALLAAIQANRDGILQALGDALVVQDALAHADVIHVIAGPDYRANYAIQLYQQGYAQTLFFTGGWCQFHHEDHLERGKALAIEQGVPPAAVAGNSSAVSSTYDEVVRLKAYIDQSLVPVRSVIVVSDPFHMRRARWTYRQVLGDNIKILMAPVPFEQTPYQRRWWTDWDSRKYVRDEYEKMAYYYARYRLSWGPLQIWLASLDKD